MKLLILAAASLFGTFSVVDALCNFDASYDPSKEVINVVQVQETVYSMPTIPACKVTRPEQLEYG